MPRRDGKEKGIIRTGIMEKNRKRTLYAVFFLLFTALSFLYIQPRQKPAAQDPGTGPVQVPSSALTRKTSQEDGLVTTWFEDEAGNLTFAADLRYARKTALKTENGILESYYDTEGNPARNTSGYYAVLREYNERGEARRLTFLGADGKPVITHEGYAVIERTFDEAGRTAEEFYFDENGEPVCTPSAGYGKRNEYDESGRISRMTFLDLSGEPMMTAAGYASVVRVYDSAEGPAAYEYYYDAQGEPAALSLGEYGIHLEYNAEGNASAVTYLGRDGRPAATTAGYTTVRRTFYPNNYIETERYYDADGKPVALAEGQYGERREAPGKTVYLDAEGNEQFSLKQALYEYPRVVILLAAALVIIPAAAGRRLNVFLLVLYTAFILYMTLMYREKGEPVIHTGLFRTYRQFISDAGTRAGILQNIWLFIPLGAIVYQLYPKKKGVLFIILFSVMIEAAQYLTGTGTCEPDDVISNGLGGLAGFAAGGLLKKLFRDRISRGGKDPGCTPCPSRRPGRDHSGLQ